MDIPGVGVLDRSWDARDIRIRLSRLRPPPPGGNLRWSPPSTAGGSPHERSLESVSTCWPLPCLSAAVDWLRGIHRPGRRHGPGRLPQPATALTRQRRARCRRPRSRSASCRSLSKRSIRPVLDPPSGPGSALAQLISEMNVYLDTLARSPESNLLLLASAPRTERRRRTRTRRRPPTSASAATSPPTGASSTARPHAPSKTPASGRRCRHGSPSCRPHANGVRGPSAPCRTRAPGPYWC